MGGTVRETYELENGKIRLVTIDTSRPVAYTVH